MGLSQNRSPRSPSTNTTTIIIVTVIIPRSIRNAPHPRRSAPYCESRAETRITTALEERRASNSRTCHAMQGFLLCCPPVSQARQQKHRIVAYISRCRGCERDGASHESQRLRDGGRLQQTTWNDSFPEGWTRLGRGRRWLVSPSGLARERAREKKKKRGHGPSRHHLRTALSQWWREGYTGAKRKKNPGWSRPAGLVLGLGAYRYMSDWATHTLCVHTTLPRSIGPKPGPVEATNSETSC